MEDDRAVDQHVAGPDQGPADVFFVPCMGGGDQTQFPVSCVWLDMHGDGANRCQAAPAGNRIDRGAGSSLA